MKRNKIKIAITGGIGSGKTEAIAAVKNAGIDVINCDEIVSKLYRRQSFLRKIKKIFPTAVTGGIFLKADKKKIAEEAFKDPEKYAELNGTVTDKALKIALKKAEKKKFSVTEVPLLFETGAEKYFDKVIVVKRDIKDRIESVKKRSNLSEEEILARIEKQFDYDGGDLSDYIVIQNDKDLKNLSAEILTAIKNV